MNNENCTNKNNQNEIGQYLDMNLSIKSMAEPEEVDDEERQKSNKPAVCVDEENPNEIDDDCPRIFNMGGNAEMLLNKGVGNYVFKISLYLNADVPLTCHAIFVERLRDKSLDISHNLRMANVYRFLKCVTKPLHESEGVISPISNGACFPLPTFERGQDWLVLDHTLQLV